VDKELLDVLGFSDHPPVVTASDFSATKGQVISASSLFSASDADNDPLTYYLYDDTPDAASGHFTVNGVAQPANQMIVVSAAQLAQTTFTAGSKVSDDLFVNAYDGLAFGQGKEFHVSVPAGMTAPALADGTVSATSSR
jgi:hypothetical protein